MPLHDYRCQGCGEHFEVFLRPSEAPVCPACGGRECERVYSGFAGPFTVGLRGAAARRSNDFRRAREEQRRERREQRREQRAKRGEGNGG